MINWDSDPFVDIARDIRSASGLWYEQAFIKSDAATERSEQIRFQVRKAILKLRVLEAELNREINK